MDSNLFYRARHERNRKEREEGRKNERERERDEEESIREMGEKRNRSHECNVFACSVVDAKQPFDTINTADR